MPFNVLLLPLLGGFIFVRYWNRTKYHAIRAEKERILLLASAAGIIALALALAVKAGLGALFPCSAYPTLPCFPDIWYRLIPFPYSAVSVLALLLGATMWVPLNRGLIGSLADLFRLRTWAVIFASIRRVFWDGWQDSEEVDRVLKEDGDPFEGLLRIAEKEFKTVQVTLVSGKVYVGFVAGNNPPSSPTRSVSLIPTKSGYRDPTTREVNYQTYYSDALERLNDDIDRLRAEFTQARWNLRRLVRTRTAKQKQYTLLAGDTPIGNPQVTEDKTKDQKAQLKAAIEEFDAKIIQAREHVSNLFEQMENLADIVNDFRLVFPVTQISTIGIYREEVNVEYFDHGTSQSPMAPFPVWLS